MSLRTACAVVVIALGVLVATHTAEAQEYHIKKGSSGSGYYTDLETLRNEVTLSDGDVIILYNDDNSLLGELVVPDHAKITIKSTGGRHTITGESGSFLEHFIVASDLHSTGNEPHIVLDNIRIANSTDLNAGAVFIHAHYDEPGSLTITNSVFENNVSRLRYGPVTIAGNIDADISNTIFRGNTVGETAGIGLTLGVGAVHAYAMAGQTLNLSIRDSIIDSNQSTMTFGAVSISGNVTASIMNTSFTDNYADASGAGALVITAATGETADVTIGVDSSYKGCYLYWEGNTAGGESSAISINTAGDVRLTADVAKDKVFYIKDNIDAYIHGPDAPDPAGNLEIIKTGQGTWKLGGETNFHFAEDSTASKNDFIIREGTVHFTEKYKLWGNVDLIVESGGVFKPSISTGDWEQRYQEFIESGGNPDPNDEWPISFSADKTWLNLESFTAMEGSKLEVGNVSSLAAGMRPRYPIMGFVGDVNYILADSMMIDNPLLKAYLTAYEDHPEWVYLRIERFEELSGVLSGVNAGADVYRRLENLTDYERDLLDDVYNKGGITNKYQLAHLQAVGGDHVALSQLAMRQHLNNLVTRVSQRITSFQDEELELCPDETSFMREGYVGTKGDATNQYTDYGEVWAYIDQTFADQKDTGDLAGYTYRPHGIAVGYDKHTSDVIYGGVARFDMGDAKLKSNKANRTEVQSLLAAAYASWSRDGYYITGGLQAGYGWNKSMTEYSIPCFSAKADSGTYSSYLFGANMEIGYLYDFGYGDYPWRIVPHAGLSYGYLTRESFSETGAGHLNRHFGSSDWNIYDMSLGVRVTRPFDVDGCLLIPSMDLSYVRTAGSAGDNNGNISFIENPSRAWSIDPMDAGRNAVHLSAGVNARLKNGWDFGVNYDFEWRRNFLSNQFNLNLSKGF